jgi:uncharacterized membrane-anchored protein YitT (DUF2179 family)
MGAGTGLIIRYGGCLDGTEVIAILVSKTTTLSVGNVVLITNVMIYSIAGFVFNWDRALFSMIAYYIAFKTIDVIEEGLDQTKACKIVTTESALIAENIYKRLGRTVTIERAEGFVSGDEKVVLFVVVTRMELSELRQIIEEDDESAFMTVMHVEEVVGNHIKRVKKEVVQDFKI